MTNFIRNKAVTHIYEHLKYLNNPVVIKFKHQWRYMQHRLINLNIFLLFSVSTFGLGYFFYQISIYLETTDFPVFYCAAQIALDPTVPISKVYDPSALMGCRVPEALNQEQKNGLHFIYSIPAAYILAPLAFFPYYYSKALIIIVDIACYLATIPILLKNISLGSASVKPFRYYLLACLWLPFQIDIRFAQINSILLLLITIATVNASRLPFLSGFLLGIASLFKLFPLSIALLFGLKNWKVAAACIFTVIISLALTDSKIWFTEIANISRIEISPIYFLINFNIYLYFSYVLAIAGITALIVFSGSFDDIFISAFSIATLFIIMPVVEYYHLVLLAIPIFYIKFNNNKKIYLILIALSSSIITICIFINEASIRHTLIFTSCLILWSLLLLHGLESNIKLLKPTKLINRLRQ